MHYIWKIWQKIEILTKGPRTKSMAWKEKVEWCNKYLLFQHGITITGDKGLVYGKVLVDDYPSYILSWLMWRPRGIVIMPAHKYNENFKHSNVIRYDGTNLEKIKLILQKTYDRNIENE